MANKAEHDLQIKILTIGDSSVGKTALLNQFANKQFSNAAIPTIGIGTHQLCPLPDPGASLPGRLPAWAALGKSKGGRRWPVHVDGYSGIVPPPR